MKVIGYWATALVVVLELLAGGMTDLIHGRTSIVSGEPVVQVLAHVGYPAYLDTILGMWKLLGGSVLLVPGVRWLKEWAYAGAFFVYLGAVASGVVLGRDDPATLIWTPFLLAVFTLASWVLRPRGRALGEHFPTHRGAGHRHGKAN